MSAWSVMRRISRYLGPYWWPQFTMALVCMVAYSATSGVIPYIVRSLVDDVFQSGNAERLKMIPLMILVAFSFRGMVSFGQIYLSEWVGQRITFDLRRDIETKTLGLPLSFFDTARTGDLLSRVTTDVLLVRQALTEGAAAIIRDTTTVIVLVLVAFYLDPALALITFLVFPCVVVPLQALSRRMRKLSEEGLGTLGNLSGLLQETIQGNRVVKAFGMEDYEAGRFEAENERLLAYYLRAAKIKASTTPMMEFFVALGIAAVLWFGGNSVLSGGRTAGGFMGFVTAVMLIYDPFKKVVRANNSVQSGLGAADRVFAILDTASEVEERPGDLSIDSFEDAIRIDGLSFSYGEERVLHNVSLELPRGTALALVGPSGGGKSTLADLIPRFYEYEQGSITLDGVDIRSIGLRSLRAMISVVTQQTFLFNDTIRNNIAYGSICGSEESLVAAAKAANAHRFIEALPQGYDTVVGEMGVRLSGGQRQRLAIARALLKDAPILILDEATSALDSQSERLVQGAIERLMEGRTTLVIAHRLSTIRNVDRIAVVASGEIAELGTHEELIESGQLYKQFYAIQFEDDPVSGRHHTI